MITVPDWALSGFARFYPALHSLTDGKIAIGTDGGYLANVKSIVHQPFAQQRVFWQDFARPGGKTASSPIHARVNVSPSTPRGKPDDI